MILAVTRLQYGNDYRACVCLIFISEPNGINLASPKVWQIQNVRILAQILPTEFELASEILIIQLVMTNIMKISLATRQNYFNLNGQLLHESQFPRLELLALFYLLRQEAAFGKDSDSSDYL